MFSTSPKFLQRTVIATALAMTTWAGVALAQDSAAEPAPSTGEKDNIQKYLNSHPDAAKQLHENPSLVNDPNWLAKNPQVNNWLQKHPDMKSRATSDPQNFVHRSEMGTLRNDHAMMNKSDSYLKAHPDERRELAANPKLIDDPNYLKQHPDLEKQLKDHPEIRQQAMEHPEKFKDAMERNQKYNNHHDRSTTSPKSTTMARRSPAAKK